MRNITADNPLGIEVGDNVVCEDEYSFAYKGRVISCTSSFCYVYITSRVSIGRNAHEIAPGIYLPSNGVRWEAYKNKLGSPPHENAFVSTASFRPSDGTFSTSEWVVDIIVDTVKTDISKNPVMKSDDNFYQDRILAARKGIDLSSGETIASQNRQGGLKFL